MFRNAIKEGGIIPGIIFTFTPDVSVRKEFIDELLWLVERNESVSIDFIEINCKDSVLMEGMNSGSRHKFKKLVNVPLFADLLGQNKFYYPYLPAPSIVIDSETTSAMESAQLIVERLGLSSLTQSNST